MINSRVTHFLLALVGKKKKQCQYYTLSWGVSFFFTFAQQNETRAIWKRARRQRHDVTHGIQIRRDANMNSDAGFGGFIRDVTLYKCLRTLSDSHLHQCVWPRGDTLDCEGRATLILLTRCSHVCWGVQEFKKEVLSANMIKQKLLNFKSVPHFSRKSVTQTNCVNHVTHTN